MTPQYARAIGDLVEGSTDWRMWSRLGWREIRRRYKRTLIGPFWTAFNVAIMVFSMGFLWAALFNQSVATYLPYLTAGMITWTFIAACMNEGATVFTISSSLLTNIRVPQSTLVLAMIWRNIIVFFHNLIIFVIVMILWRIPITIYTPLFILGLALVAMNAVWMATILGLISTRFRDIPQLLGGIITIVMFLTPIMWSRDILKGHEAIAFTVDVNPFFHMVDIIRSPLLGKAPSLTSWAVVILLIPAGGALGLYLSSRFRQRVTYWL